MKRLPFSLCSEVNGGGREELVETQEMCSSLAKMLCVPVGIMPSKLACNKREGARQHPRQSLPARSKSPGHLKATVRAKVMSEVLLVFCFVVLF